MPLSRIQQGGNFSPLVINNIVASGLVVTGNESINGSLTISGGLTVGGTVGSLILSGSITIPTTITSGVITTSGTALVLQQTGDQFGTTQLQIQNRNGLNGILVSNPSIPLVDYGSLPQNYLVPADFRAEGRASSNTYSIANTTSGIEYQMWPAGAQGATAAPAFAVSAYAAIFTVPVQLTSATEKVYIAATSPTTTTNITTNSGSVWLFTSAASNVGPWTFNLTTSGTLNSLLSIGQSITASVMVTMPASPASYYANAIQVDGSVQTVYWQNATTPTAGQAASALDVYSITAIKTSATPTWTVLASQTKF